MVYRCIPMDSKKDCSGKLEMRILGQDEADRNRNGKQHPCQVSIHFYHNHNTTNNTVFNMESFKAQDIPSHLKEGFEGYFQETMQPVTTSGPTTLNLNALKPHPPMLNSPLTHSLSSTTQPIVIKTDSPLSPVSHGQHLDGKLLNRSHQPQELYDLNDVSLKLDNTLQVLRRMLKQSGTGVTAVKQFVDKFEKLQGDQNQLEDALTSFGGQWDWLVAADPGGQPVVQTPVTVTSTQHLLSSHQSLHSPPSDLSSPKKKPKKKIKLDEKEIAALTSTPQSVFSTNIVGGQLVLQQQTPVTPLASSRAGADMHTPDTAGGGDSKKRKRARCGNCTGCLNRDKTQDCRQCRNCLDQKRYGGPGRLKKACIKRQCVVISQPGSGMTLSSSSDSASSDTKPPIVTAVKSEPVYSVKPADAPPTISIAPAPTTTAAPTTLLSWPGAGGVTQFSSMPTFQLQVQQPVQFAFQPSSGLTPSYTPVTCSGQPGLQYTTSAGQIQTLSATQLENITNEVNKQQAIG